MAENPLTDGEWLDFRAMALNVTNGDELALADEARWDGYCRRANITHGFEGEDDDYGND